MSLPKILVVANEKADAELAADALRHEFKAVQTSCDAAQSVADFERHQPDVLLLAFRDLGEADRRYSALCQASELARGHPHRTLILCRSEDVLAAFGLCKGGRFDDYMKFWPNTFDIHQLPMSVLHALKYLRTAEALERSANELLAHANRVAAIDPFLTRALADGEKQVQRTSESVQQIHRQMTTLLDADGAARATELGSGAFRARLQTLVDQVEGLVKWSGELRKESEPHLQWVRSLAKSSVSLGLRAAGLAAKRAPILVVEDDEFQQKLLARLLDQESLQSEAALTGSAALEAVGRYVPSLILLDYELPDTDGISVLRSVRANPALAKVPVIMLTGNSDKQIVVTSLQAGANDFMVKPVNPQRLREKLRQHLGSAAELA